MSRDPLSSASVTARPSRTAATTVFVVPRSIPTAAPISESSLSAKSRAVPKKRTAGIAAAHLVRIELYEAGARGNWLRMPFVSAILVLLSALLHAAWNALLKRENDPRTAGSAVLAVATVTATAVAGFAASAPFPHAAGMAWTIAARSRGPSASDRYRAS